MEKKKRHKWIKNKLWAGGAYCSQCGYSLEVAHARKGKPCGWKPRGRKQGKPGMDGKKYKIQGRLSGETYARARTLREARAKRREVSERQFIDESNLEIVGPLGKATL